MIRRTLSLAVLVGTLVGLYLVVLSGSFGWFAGDSDGAGIAEASAAAVEATRASAPASGQSHRGVAVDLDTLDRLAAGATLAEAAPADPAANLIANPDLVADDDGDDLADCWRRLQVGTVDAAFERHTTTDPATGATRAIETAEIRSPGDGNIKLTTLQDAACSPVVGQGDQLVLTTSMRATAPARPSLFRLNEQGQWVFWVAGPYLYSDGEWHTSRWALPPVPPGTSRVSIGIELGDVGRLEVDHVGLVHDRANRVAGDPTAVGDATTVVSLTFDDGRASQIRALPVLEAHGVAASFFVNSGRVGLDGFLTVAQLHQLADAGHEIGGHTVDHARLVALAPDEQRRQICNDRAVLSELGFASETFAYPLSARDLTAIDAVAACGYGAARLAGGLDIAGLPAQPLDHIRPYQVPAMASVTDRTTVADLRAAVEAAEETGGWINVVFHDLCDGCNEFAMSVEEFDAFVAWVAARADRGTTVLPFGAVMGRGSTAPAMAGPPSTRDVDPDTALANADFAVIDQRDPGVPWCWDAGWSAGIDASVSVVDDEADVGRFVRVHIDGTVPVGATARIESARDQGECSPSASAGVEPVVSLRYRGTGEAVVEVYVRDPSGAWRFHTRSEPLGHHDDWHRQAWVASPLPDDSVAMSIRVALRAPGTIDVDDVVVGLAQRPGAPRPAKTAAG